MGEWGWLGTYVAGKNAHARRDEGFYHGFLQKHLHFFVLPLEETLQREMNKSGEPMNDKPCKKGYMLDRDEEEHVNEPRIQWRM